MAEIVADGFQKLKCRRCRNYIIL